MSRQKLSEYRAKQIITGALELPYNGWSIDTQVTLDEQLDVLPDSTNYVVKVDEATKGRFKQGLVLLDVPTDGLPAAVQALADKGYQWLIIEPLVAHEPAAERYLSLTSERQGIILRYAEQGGVDVEANPDAIKQVTLTDETDLDELNTASGLSPAQLKALLKLFQDNYFTFMEINPYLVNDNGLQLLDAAVEVDDAGAFFVNSWQPSDFRRHSGRPLTESEKIVQELAENSPAAFTLSVLEPNGSIFLLLSGGGASVVVADEVYNQGYGKQLANYGEYSGNPNTEETYIYTKAALQLLLNSSASAKVLFIGGAVANFTDIAKTFDGVIQALTEVAEQLRAQGVKVFVRRGGPNQETGLQRMEAALREQGLLGAVHSPDTPLTDAVREALEVVHG